MGVGGIHDLGFLPAAPGDIGTDSGVSPLHLVVQGLSDIMKQTAPQRELCAGPQLSGDSGGDMGHLDGMFQNVLAIGGAILETAE